MSCNSGFVLMSKITYLRFASLLSSGGNKDIEKLWVENTNNMAITEWTDVFTCFYVTLESAAPKY